MGDVITVIASFLPKPGQEARVEQILRGMVGPTRREPGCRRYDLYAANGSPARLVLFEIYQDQASLDADLATEHYKAYRTGITELLSGPIEVRILQSLDVAAR